MPGASGTHHTGVGSGAAGVLRATEGPDRFSGYVPISAGALSGLEAGDSAPLTGVVPDSILTATEAPDDGDAAGGVMASGAAAATERGDVAGWRGYFNWYGSAAILERGDVGAFAGTCTSPGALAAAELGDRAAIAAAVQNAPVLAALEAGDAGAFAGSCAVAAALRAGEAGDVAAFVPAHGVAGRIAAGEAGDRGGFVAVAEGIPPAFRVMESGDVGGFIGGTAAVGYNVYASPLPDTLIDYSAPVATVAVTDWATAPVPPTPPVVAAGGPFPAIAFAAAWMPPAAYPKPLTPSVSEPAGKMILYPGAWSFGVRAEGEFGEEKNRDYITIVLDEWGSDITNRPAPPVGLRAVPTAGGGLNVMWGHPGELASGPTAPTGFRVYIGAGATPDYGQPAAVVAADTGILGSWSARLAGLASGVTYAVGVRAFNASGEETNTATVSATAAGAGPGPSAVSMVVGAAVV